MALSYPAHPIGNEADRVRRFTAEKVNLQIEKSTAAANEEVTS
jgi:hypothetical protein